MSTLASPAPAEATRAERELYLKDPYSWARWQSDLLRRRDFKRVDWESVIEEIEDVGRSTQARWTSLCARAVEHLLKMQYWGSRNPDALGHWSREVRNFRHQMARVPRRSPGLKGRLDGMFAEAWEDGREDAARALADYEEEDLGADAKAAERRWLATIPEQPAFGLDEIAGMDPRKADQPAGTLGHPLWSWSCTRECPYPATREGADTPEDCSRRAAGCRGEMIRGGSVTDRWLSESCAGIGTHLKSPSETRS